MLMECADCGGPFSGDASRCPRCGGTSKRYQGAAKTSSEESLLGCLVGTPLGLIAVGCMIVSRIMLIGFVLVGVTLLFGFHASSVGLLVQTGVGWLLSYGLYRGLGSVAETLHRRK